jgi:hypothetical protein
VAANIIIDRLDREIREDKKISKNDKWKKCVNYEGTYKMIPH